MKNLRTLLIMVVCIFCVACGNTETKSEKESEKSAEEGVTEQGNNAQGGGEAGETASDDAAKKAADEAAAKKAVADQVAAKQAAAQTEEGKVANTEETKTEDAPAEEAPAKAVPAPGDIPAPDDVAAAPADAEATASGLKSKVLQAGTGTDRPAAVDEVTVHYTGWTTDGKMFDSSVKRGEPTSFPLNRVIKGWTEGLQLMVTGEKRRFWIPGDLAYGNTPQGGRPYGTLVFDVELISYKAAPKPPEVPEDLAAAPADAKKTDSGLAYKVLTPGTGTEHPTATSSVEVHYSGWQTDGKMFDSSVARGRPVTFPLNRVIKGWTEGVQLMVVGERTRFWIPAEMTYGNDPSGRRPSGLLVFDIELMSIK